MAAKLPLNPKQQQNSIGLLTFARVVGWCDGAGKLPVPRRPTILMTVGQGPTALAVGAGGGCLDIFTLSYPFFPLSPYLWEPARYRLKYCLKGLLNPKQPTKHFYFCFLLLYSGLAVWPFFTFKEWLE